MLTRTLASVSPTRGLRAMNASLAAALALGSRASAMSVMSDGLAPAILSTSAMAPAGNTAQCFLRLIRSSAMAAMIPFSFISTADESGWVELSPRRSGEGMLGCAGHGGRDD